MTSLQKYYGPKGRYLKEHKAYFSKKRLGQEVAFLIDTLRLKKKDKILDLACGSGRHTIALAKKGFNIAGLDFSAHLLKIARRRALQEGVSVKFYRQNVQKITIKTKYDKIFLFFSEFGSFNAEKVLANVAQLLRPKGLFLLDTDNVFRLVRYLARHPGSKYRFDFADMRLREKQKRGPEIRYYVVPELKKLLQNHGFKIACLFGNYQKAPLAQDSKRIIIVAQKISGK